NRSQRMTHKPTLTFALTAFEPTKVATRSRTPPSAATIRRLGSPGLTLPVDPREREHADLLSHHAAGRLIGRRLYAFRNPGRREPLRLHRERVPSERGQHRVRRVGERASRRDPAGRGRRRNERRPRGAE